MLRQEDQEKNRRRVCAKRLHCKWEPSLPYMHDHSRSRFENRSGIKWDLKRPVMHPTSRDLLEEQIPETAREVLSAALKTYYKQHKILSPIYVILVQEFQWSHYIYSLGKGTFGYIKFPCRQYSLLCCILPLASHNILCHYDRENTVHKALQGPSTKKKYTPRNSIPRKCYFRF